MLIYIINYLTIPIYSWFFKNRKLFVVCMSIQLFLILSLRAADLGIDLKNYYEGYNFISGLKFNDLLTRLHFLKVADLTEGYSYESGYVVFNWIVSFLGLDFQGFLIIHAFIFTVSIGLFISKYSKNYMLSYSLLLSFPFFTDAFFILRQTLAMCILLYATDSLIKHKNFRCLLLTTLAFTFHRAAIAYLGLFLLSKIKLNKKIYLTEIILIFFFFVLMALSWEQLLPILFKFFGKVSYLSFNFKLNNLFLLMLFIMLIVYFSYSFQQGSSCSNVLLQSIIASLLIEIPGLFQEIIARAVSLVFINIIALVPMLLQNRKYQRELSWMLYVALGIFMVYLLNGSSIVPYRFSTNFQIMKLF